MDKRTKIISLNRTVTLLCQAGQHYWERPAQRGRPPVNCPEHAPEKPVKAPKEPPRPIVLFCQPGQHYWERRPKKGRLPNHCPEHAPLSVSEEKAKQEAERLERERADMQVELLSLTTKIPEVERKYEAALSELGKAETVESVDSAGKLVEVLQNSFMNYLNRRRSLQRKLFGIAQ